MNTFISIISMLYNILFAILATTRNKAYQLLAHGRWFSPASATTKTGRHDIAEVLPKVALNTKIQIKMNHST
jgi:hypothetical protein